MSDIGKRIDRVGGRIFTRVLAVVLGFISTAMLVIALVSRAWAGMAAAWIWFGGAAFFGVLAVLCWRSRARLSDVQWD